MKNKRNIILVDAQDQNDTICEPLLGLISIGTLLKKEGYDVVVLRILSNNVEKISKFINKRTLAVGLSVKTMQIQPSLKLSKFIKKNFPHVKIIWGGIHPILFPEQTLKNENIDVVVLGDGEYTMLEIAKKLEKKKSLRGVKGCAYKSKGKLIFNKPREPVDISKLPKYDYSLVYDIEDYINESKGARKNYSGAYLPIQSGVGCPFNCSFCYNTREKLRRSKRTVKQMLDEIDELQKKYNVHFFRMNDELFFADKKRIEEFIKEKKKRGLRFRWEGNFHIALLKTDYYSDEFIKELISEGLTNTGIGAEAGSIQQLKRYRKGITPSDILKVTKRLDRLGLFAAYTFMIGAPYETYDEMIQTAKLIYLMNAVASRINTVSPQIFRPYPGCDLYKDAVKLGFKEPKKLEEWRDINPATGYTTYEDLPYIQHLLPKIYNIFYYIKLIKFLLRKRLIAKIARKPLIFKIATHKHIINLTGLILRKTIENKVVDYLNKKIFRKSFILEK